MIDNGTAERPRSTTLALRLCRILIFALIVMLAIATLYVVALGGVTGGGHLQISKTIISGDGPGTALALNLSDADADLPPGAGIEKRIVQCTDKGGSHTCLTTDLPPLGAAAAKPDGTRVRIECRSDNGKTECTENGKPVAADKVMPPVQKDAVHGSETRERIVTPDGKEHLHKLELRGLPGGGERMLDIDLETLSPWRLALMGVLGGASLLLLLTALFNLERLLAVMERASLFSQAAVRRMQWVGLALLATAVLPHFEIPAVVANAAAALLDGSKPGAAPILFSLEFSAVPLVAGLFLILMARVVEEGVWLHDEMRGTV